MQLFDNTATIFEMLWDIALAYFVIRLGAIYALLVFTSSAAISFISGWAQQHPVPQIASLLFVAQLTSTVACALFINTYHDIPQNWRLRAGVGGVGAILVTVATTMLKPTVVDMQIGRGYLACVAVMPVILTALEKRFKGVERNDLGLLHGKGKMGF
ncbi:hypothetical protein B0T11DRAFT_69239 [Plectosphaerella cucumerina]|uniref:Uncharacterized protein n=1 Tax=Plectosphaerella cucumerina TaxID=40658 RepID=A0A8K0X8H3_9PEZI|nr:hypothetical protein B0T11DRAFT_69239 [Plectosphaerella cucumerina]